MMTMPKQPETGTFLSHCIKLYEKMLSEIRVCKKEKSNEEDCIQCCFEIAGSFKEKITAAVREHVFDKQEDEIFFFKTLKPLFQAEVEFYTYCYHIILFKTKETEADKQELISFYKRQLQRKEKLRKEQPVFYEYVQGQNTYADAQWFTRRSNSKDSSLFDALMGRYLAIEKFEDYLQGLMIKEL